ncbi:hypothetical protein [Phaeocystidibacter marisrubri]|uniref:Uncharacterized protein n=1 Tax=Phaeocystidibacter marisrubri TaxID=1577780 RepID=A0A6L3ZHX6_9FLAO|nr:hypothetical protein [Phaeocystidibacter marisrubri]KAB2817085.1 hypothetical protein F8C82_01425 [Phaeocystidibacter marisrubri]
MKFITFTLLLIATSCGMQHYRYSKRIHRFNNEHISTAIYELGPNYTIKTDPIIGKVYTWRNATYLSGSIDTSGNYSPPVYNMRFIHLYTNTGDTVTNGIYSIR